MSLRSLAIAVAASANARTASPAAVLLMFVVFFFVWGGVNNVIKLFGRDVSSIETPVGLYAGFLAALATPFVIWRVKRRKK